MLILCAIGSRAGADLVRRAISVAGKDCRLLLLHVVDTHPRHGLLPHLRGPLRHGPHGGPERDREMTQAEENGSRDALQEAQEAARQAGIETESRMERGHPEHVIVEIAGALNASFIVIGARERKSGHPQSGPGSVGHTARFVLDHSPCDVLLLR